MIAADTREFAIELAQRAGALALRFQTRGFAAAEVRTKSHHADLVTAADVAVERLVIEAIRARYPDHAIFAEESAVGALPDSQWMWLIDPVDGTTNFAHGLPIFCVNLALALDQVPVLGVTCEAAAGRTYWAETGGGAWLRLETGAQFPLRVSVANDLQRSLLSTGFAHGRRASTDASLTEFAALDAQTHAVRRLGSAALSLAWVAAGRLEAHWEAELKPWDSAAGSVLVTEAGGRISDPVGRPWRLQSPGVIASNGQEAIHNAILETIRATRSSVLYLTRSQP